MMLNQLLVVLFFNLRYTRFHFKKSSDMAMDAQVREVAVTIITVRLNRAVQVLQT